MLFRPPGWYGSNCAAFSGEAAEAATLPQTADLIGEWRAEDYDATRVAIPNRRTAEPLGNSVVTTQRSMFNSTRYFTRTNVTVVDNAVAGPDGKTFASTVVWGSADATLLLADPGSFPIGTYTMTVDIRTTDGATVDIRMGRNTALETKTVNGTWASYSVTFTMASAADPALAIRSLNSSTPANLAIDNWRVHEGSSDLGVDTLAGHIYFGRSKYNTARHPTSVSGNVIVQNASNRYGFLQYADDLALTDYTVVMVGRRAGTNTHTQACLAKAENPAQFAAIYASSDATALMQYGGSTLTTSGTGPSSFWAQVGDWCVITQRYFGSEGSIWMDDLKVGIGTAASRSASVRNMFMHHTGSGAASQFAAWDFYAVLIWDRALTDAEVVQAYNYFEEVAAADSIDLSPDSIVMVAEGDSITYGTGASSTNLGSYAKRADPNLSPRVSGRIAAISGARLADGVVAREAANIAMLPASKRGRRYMYSLLIGRNDHPTLIPGGEATYAADVAAHLARMQAAGFEDIILCTLLPDPLAGWNTARNNLNAIYTGTGWASSRGITICDFAADPTMGPDAAASDATLYPDGTHPSDLGYNTLEPVWRAVVNAL